QKLSAAKPNEQVGPKLSAGARTELKKRLADRGLKLVNFGVGPSDRETFEFAKDMGIETLVSEPAFDAFDHIAQLCEKYQINVAPREGAIRINLPGRLPKSGQESNIDEVT